MGFNIFTIAGTLGAAILILAFFATQQGWLAAGDRVYLVGNLVGAALILVSLRAQWNLPSAIIEAFWAAISLFGLLKGARKARFR